METSNNEVTPVGNKSKSISVTRNSEVPVVKFKSAKTALAENSTEQRGKSGNGPSHSDLTDLSSTKSGLGNKLAEIKLKTVTKMKSADDQPVEQISKKRIRTLHSNELSYDRNKALAELEMRKTGKFTIEDPLIVEPSVKPIKFATNKEVEIESLSGLKMETSNNLFTNDLSCIKNEGVLTKNKENSEIYDQWLGDSNTENIATQEWTAKVEKIV